MTDTPWTMVTAVTELADMRIRRLEPYDLFELMLSTDERDEGMIIVPDDALRLACALAPEMAAAVLAAEEHECLEKCGKCVWCMQQKLREVCDRQ